MASKNSNAHDLRPMVKVSGDGRLKIIEGEPTEAMLTRFRSVVAGDVSAWWGIPVRDLDHPEEWQPLSVWDERMLKETRLPSAAQAARLREDLVMAGVDEEGYRARLDAVLAESKRGGQGVLVHMAFGLVLRARLWAAQGGWSDLEAKFPGLKQFLGGLWSQFMQYQHDAQAELARKPGEKVMQAMQHLADTLRDTQLSSAFLLTPEGLNEVGEPQVLAAARRDLQQNHGIGFWPRPAACAVRLEDHLRAVIALMPEMEIILPAPSHPNNKPPKQKNFTRRFFTITWLLDRIADSWPEQGRTRHGFNELAARVATLILSEEMIANDVAQIARRGHRSRSYHRD